MCQAEAAAGGASKEGAGKESEEARKRDEEEEEGVEHRTGIGKDAGKGEGKTRERNMERKRGREKSKKRRDETRVREVPKEGAKKRVDSGVSRTKLHRFLSKAIQLWFGLCPPWAMGAMGELGEMSILTCHKSVDTYANPETRQKHLGECVSVGRMAK